MQGDGVKRQRRRAASLTARRSQRNRLFSAPRRRSDNRPRQLLLDPGEWAEHEVRVVRRAAPEDANQLDVVPARDAENARAAVAAVYVGLHECLAEEVHGGAGDAAVGARPDDRALAPTGGATDLVQRSREVRAVVILAGDRERPVGVQTAGVHAGRLGDDATAGAGGARVGRSRGITPSALLPLRATLAALHVLRVVGFRRDRRRVGAARGLVVKRTLGATLCCGAVRGRDERALTTDVGVEAEAADVAAEMNLDPSLRGPESISQGRLHLD